ncbi:class I SAM-dependent methyltransferase [Sagittula sp. MA-2]|jgi:SAM-dependent methyltransferase|uniref:class I SAM-dependent methyltransferase n=1 Tax=Sagittula sp. MA-2 TaxID=3048007 RepID=UPI0024C27406|nr:class I SAM-dependent methyltransferase [Sagittula sp. MA-2]WHZ34537.1 class I SAM-dependent methyltransferase [Sagittula sp. MA-2]
MSDWSQGYPTDSAYIDAIQVEITPWRWAQAMHFGGLRCPDPGKPFRFLELGCGSAMTLIALAAAYPWAEFTGYDFMPEHIVMANRLIDEIGLTNIEVREGSFAEMAAAPPAEKYDFAAAHGVWAWVPPDVREEIVDVLGTWMAPGSVAYFGYNAAAGWCSAAPIRKIFRSAPLARSADARYGAARAATQAWVDMVGDGYPQMRLLWNKLSEAPDHFLAHEIASSFGTGQWMEDLGRPLERAKMAFAGPAVLVEHMDALYLDAAEMDFLKKAVEGGWAETARDLLLRRTFRNDLFHRGAMRMPGPAMVAAMRDLKVVAWDEALDMGTHPSVGDQLKRGLPDDVLAGLKQVAGDGGRTFGDCMAALDVDTPQAFQAVMTAYVSGALLDLRPGEQRQAAQDGCDGFNAAMLRRLKARKPMPGFVSPAWGGPIQFGVKAHRAVVAGEAEDSFGLKDRLATLGITV